MILVTGGTGFVGRHLVEQLIASGRQVRILLRPSIKTPNLPKGKAVEAAVCSLQDERGLRAAMRGVDVVIHLAGTERYSSRAELQNVDIHGTQHLAAAAAQSNVRRFLFLSHLGAESASAYPVFKAKALAEKAIVNTDIPYTILRSAVIFGPGDQFTTSLARLLRLSPGMLLIPGDGGTLLQPIWIHDVVSCLMVAMENEQFANQTISIAGLETLTFLEVVEQIMSSAGIRRRIIHVSPAAMRIIALVMDTFTKFPVSIFWLDYLSANRTTQLDVLPRLFGIMPARFHTQLGYLAQPAKAGIIQRSNEG